MFSTEGMLNPQCFSSSKPHQTDLKDTRTIHYDLKEKLIKAQLALYLQCGTWVQGCTSSRSFAHPKYLPAPPYPALN